MDVRFESIAFHLISPRKNLLEGSASPEGKPGSRLLYLRLLTDPDLGCFGVGVVGVKGAFRRFGGTLKRLDVPPLLAR